MVEDNEKATDFPTGMAGDVLFLMESGRGGNEIVAEPEEGSGAASFSEAATILEASRSALGACRDGDAERGVPAGVVLGVTPRVVRGVDPAVPDGVEVEEDFAATEVTEVLKKSGPDGICVC